MDIGRIRFSLIVDGIRNACLIHSCEQTVQRAELHQDRVGNYKYFMKTVFFDSGGQFFDAVRTL